MSFSDNSALCHLVLPFDLKSLVLFLQKQVSNILCFAIAVICAV